MSLFKGKKTIFHISPVTNNTDREKKLEHIGKELDSNLLKHEYEKCRKVR